MKNHKIVFGLFYFFCFLFGMNTSYAQYSIIEIGVEGGPGIISLRGNDILSSNTKSRVGFLAGIYGQYNFSENIGMKLAVNYQLKGADIENSYIEGNNVQYSYSGYQDYNYITIPLLLKGTFGGKVKFFVNAGPYIGILLSDEYSVQSNSSLIGNENTITNSDNTKSTEFGITGGIGTIIPISPQWALTFEIRDDLGLTNISSARISDDESIMTNAASLIAGFSYSICNPKSVKRKKY